MVPRNPSPDPITLTLTLTLTLTRSAGASCTGKSRIVFDEFLRTKMKEAGSKAGLLATRGLVYDFVFDTDETKWR